MKKGLAIILSLSIIMSLLPMTVFAATSPQDMVKKIGIGMNLGNTFDAPTEGSWSKAAQEYYFDDYKQAGFKHIRIPIRWDQHALANSPYTIDSSFLDRIETVVNWSLSRGFVTVINSHHDTWLMDNYSQNIGRFEKIWEQIAERFKGKSENLVFEILNEPHGNITDSQINDMNRRILSIIRKTNPTRNVIIGSGYWNSFNTLSLLEIPNDPNLIATFHYYDPYTFTHQWKGTWGTKNDMDAINMVFNQVKKWSDKNNIPVYLGEYGVMRNSDRTSAVKWFDFVSDQATSHGFASGAWDNGVFGSADNDMAFYNRDTRQFDREILNAILTTGTTYNWTPPTPTDPDSPHTPATPAYGEQLIEDFEGTMQWAAYSGVKATASCKISSGKSNNGLEITYAGSSDGYWGVVDNKHRNQDWEKWQKISFDIKSSNTNEVRLLIAEQSKIEGEDGEHWTYVIKPSTSWTTIEIPFSSFTRRMDYQPPAQDGSGTFDVYKIGPLHFMYSNGNSGTLNIDNIKLVGLPEVQPEGKIGDVNADGNINALDFALLKKYLLDPSNSINKKNADINVDGDINAIDFAKLKKILIEN
jgi:endoglucanase